MNPEYKVHTDADALIEAAAAHFVSTARAAIARRGAFYVALAGGSTPKGLYQKLASEPYRDQLDWARVHLFFGDERFVPADHDDSNYKMARQAMIDHVPVPAENVHRVPTEKGEPAAVAADYAETLKQVLSEQPFDLVLLGLGPDGHIASLFPETPALDVTDQSVTSLYVEKFDADRISFTYPTIHAARQVIVFIAGEGKAAIVSDIREQKVSGLPVQRLNPDNEYYWFMDQAAAGQ